MLMILYSLLFLILVIVSINDLRTFTIDNKFILMLLALGIINTIYTENYIDNILAAFIIFIVLIISSFIGLKIGMGDIKLISVSAFFLGIKGVFIAFMIGMVLSAFVGLILLIIKKIEIKDKIALAPYLSVGIIVVLILLK